MTKHRVEHRVGHLDCTVMPNQFCQIFLLKSSKQRVKVKVRTNKITVNKTFISEQVPQPLDYFKSRRPLD